jgi:hypothetical protein
MGTLSCRSLLGVQSCALFPPEYEGRGEYRYCVGDIGPNRTTLQLLDVWTLVRDWHRDIDKRGFVDLRTRLVVVSVVLSSPYADVDIQAVCTFRFEFSREGIVIPSYDIQPVSRNGTAQLHKFIWVLALLLSLVMCVEMVGVVLHGPHYLVNVWNGLTLVLVTIGWLTVGLVRALSVSPSDSILMVLDSGKSSSTLIDTSLLISKRIAVTSVLTSVIAFGCCLVWLRMLMFTTALPAAHLCLSSIGKMGRELVMFLVIIVMIQLGFATAFLVRFRVFSHEYAFIGRAVLSLFRVLFGDFDFDIYTKTDLENLAPFCIAVYGFIMLFVLLNVFIAILSKGFDDRWDNKGHHTRRGAVESLLGWAHRAASTESYQRYKRMNDDPASGDAAVHQETSAEPTKDVSMAKLKLTSPSWPRSASPSAPVQSRAARTAQTGVC